MLKLKKNFLENIHKILFRSYYKYTVKISKKRNFSETFLNKKFAKKYSP